MNVICLAGNITRDAEVRFTPGGDAVANFAVADNQGKDKPAIFWNCALYGKRAESLAPYLVKGQSVTISGNVTEREWTDKEGNKRKQMDVRVADVALQGGKREDAPTKRQQPNSRNDESFPDEIPF
jgi:single-strand DNA-binding protein